MKGEWLKPWVWMSRLFSVAYVCIHTFHTPTRVVYNHNTIYEYPHRLCKTSKGLYKPHMQRHLNNVMSRLTPWDQFSWRWVTEREYYAGQPSVLDDSDCHLPAGEELGWGRLEQDKFQRYLTAPQFYVLGAYLHEAVSLVSINTIPWLWWNNSSLPFFCAQAENVLLISDSATDSVP